MSLADLIKKGGLRRLATSTVATPATVNPDNLPTVASVTVAEPQNAKPEPPEAATLTDVDMADPPGWLEARLERAAILEYQAGMTHAKAETEAARLHRERGADDGETWHGFTRRELLALADPTERADLEAAPVALEAFGFALRLTEIRSRGELPDHYTRKALCRACGPVWLFPGEAKRVLGCPWCENTANGRPIPRPPVMCSDCRHWRPNTINPHDGLGSCAIAAPTSKRPGTLWPRGEITCGDWRP